MQVTDRHRDLTVAQDLFHRFKIRPGHYQVGSKRVPEVMESEPRDPGLAANLSHRCFRLGLAQGKGNLLLRELRRLLRPKPPSRDLARKLTLRVDHFSGMRPPPAGILTSVLDQCTGSRSAQVTSNSGFGTLIGGRSL